MHLISIFSPVMVIQKKVDLIKANICSNTIDQHQKKKRKTLWQYFSLKLRLLSIRDLNRPKPTHSGCPLYRLAQIHLGKKRDVATTGLLIAPHHDMYDVKHHFNVRMVGISVCRATHEAGALLQWHGGGIQ